VYHIPVGTGYLSIYENLVDITYATFSMIYGYILLSNIVILTAIQLKPKVTLTFIRTMLYLQVANSIINIMVCFYIFSDLRFLILICVLLALMFLFIQSSLIISISTIAMVSVAYLAISYIGIVVMKQNGSLWREVVTLLIFQPVSIFMAYMCSIVQKQHKELKTSRDQLKSTFSELEQVYSELETTHKELEGHNHRMLESIHYAEMIQRSLLPGVDRMKTETPESLIIWMPKDIVGGDIFFTFTQPGRTIVALIDCTGHGVPGAFLTMITYGEIRKIIFEDSEKNPAEILRRLNRSMKNALQKDTSKKSVDDGLDAAVVDVDHDLKTIRYSGANIPLIYTDDGVAFTIKGDKQSIGYFNSNENHNFTEHTLRISGDGCVYIKTDGLTDQLGGEKNIRFGTSRFTNLITSIHRLPFARQRVEIVDALTKYKGGNEQMDDITVIGFKI
jgi:serine phosphatase RsbU (regulator of sigma subunit)